MVTTKASLQGITVTRIVTFKHHHAMLAEQSIFLKCRKLIGCRPRNKTITSTTGSNVVHSAEHIATFLPTYQSVFMFSIPSITTHTTFFAYPMMWFYPTIFSVNRRYFCEPTKSGPIVSLYKECERTICAILSHDEWFALLIQQTIVTIYMHPHGVCFPSRNHVSGSHLLCPLHSSGPICVISFCTHTHIHMMMMISPNRGMGNQRRYH